MPGPLASGLVRAVCLELTLGVLADAGRAIGEERMVIHNVYYLGGVHGAWKVQCMCNLWTRTLWRR